MNFRTNKLLRVVRSERGESTAGVVIYLMFFGVACFIFNVVVGWIYDTKEARLENREAQKRKGLLAEKPTYGLGTYSVTYDGSSKVTQVDNL